MRKINVFLVLLFASLVSLVILVISGFYIFTSSASTQPTQQNWMGNMWGYMDGMMGGNTAVTNSALPYFAVGFIVLIIVAIVGVGGVVYFLMFPQIKPASLIAKDKVVLAPQTSETPYDSVVKTLTVEERKVLDVLTVHGGKYLQKYIRTEAGLSRLKTHRVVVRLAERGIVTLEKSGNTNAVLLANWLRK